MQWRKKEKQLANQISSCSWLTWAGKLFWPSMHLRVKKSRLLYLINPEHALSLSLFTQTWFSGEWVRLQERRKDGVCLSSFQELLYLSFGLKLQLFYHWHWILESNCLSQWCQPLPQQTTVVIVTWWESDYPYCQTCQMCVWDCDACRLSVSTALFSEYWELSPFGKNIYYLTIFFIWSTGHFVSNWDWHHFYF